MTRKTRSELISDITTLFLDNTNREISPADLRSIATDQADSVPFRVVSQNFAPDSADDAVASGGNGELAAGDMWYNVSTNKIYICTDDSENSAVWLDLSYAIEYFNGTIAVNGIDIDSGSIDGTAIGSSNPDEGSFTNLTVSTNLDVFGDVSAAGDLGVGGSLGVTENIDITGNINASGDIVVGGSLDGEDADFTSLTVGGVNVLLDGGVDSIDADLLEGQDGSYYLNLDNATGTLDDGRLSFSVEGYGKTLINAANIGEAQGLLDLVPGTDIQAHDDNLDAIAGLETEADKVTYWTGAGAAALADFGSVARDFLAAATKAAQRTYLELGAAATKAIATQPDAEAGTGTAVMTAERTAQAIAAQAGGGLEFILSADADDDTSLDFTAFDATKYGSYLFVLSNVLPATDNEILSVVTSSDGGATWDEASGDYDWGRASGNINGSTGTRGIVNAAYIELANIVGNDAATDSGYSGTFDVLGPHLVRQTQMLYGGAYTGTTGDADRGYAGAATRTEVAVVDGIRFAYVSGNIASGTITMYGRRNS